MLIISKIKLPEVLKPVTSRNINKTINSDYELPFVTMIVSSFGETKETIRDKILNIIESDYPKDKLEVIFALALENNNTADEALIEYYDNFLKEPMTIPVNSKDEELYSKFILFENIDKTSVDELSRLEEALSKENISSENLTINSKFILDDHYKNFSLHDEVSFIITKDIERKGKLPQIIRSLKFAKGEIIVFTDANALINKEGLKKLVRHFKWSDVGCVAGEKRIKSSKFSTSAAGEGMYWKYESMLKKLDSYLWSSIGAAGEIYAVRKNLCLEHIENDVIIEDFVLSVNIAKNGYRVIYESDAYAIEEPTSDYSSEFKRKTRIIAGGFQAIFKFPDLFNIFKYRVLSFQYISHRVLRWFLVPFLFPIILLLNIYLFNNSLYFSILLLLQLFFYLIGIIGLLLEKINIKIKLFQIVSFFIMSNISAYFGLIRYLFDKQKMTWEKSR